MKPFFCVTEKSKQIFSILEQKKILRWNKKHFSSFLKGSCEKLFHTWEFVFKDSWRLFELFSWLLSYAYKICMVFKQNWKKNEIAELN